MKLSANQKTSAPRRKRALTTKGQRTRQALLDSARLVFENDGYFGASISEIGRRCGASQGTFYQYFRNKEQIFRELIDSALFGFWDRADKIEKKAGPFEHTFKAGLSVLLEHCRDHAALHRVLNEFELIETVTISYYDSIARYFRGFFREAARQGQIKLMDPNLIAYTLIGVAIFLQMRWYADGKEYDLEQLIDNTHDFMVYGISGDKPWQSAVDLDAFAAQDNHEGQLHWEDMAAPGKRTRRAIFQAAEQVLGEYGYSRASIAEITRRAGVAQGTFYVHFKSKEELIYGVVRFLSHELRRELRCATADFSDRRDQEIQGLLTFFRFLGQHSLIYRIVSESEAIVPESAEYYYGKLASGYTASLSRGVADKEIRPFPLDFLSAALMGINHMIGLRWLVWSSAVRPEIPRQVVADAVDLISNGLRV
jgi:AcrR family transcriptional regulator